MYFYFDDKEMNRANRSLMQAKESIYSAIKKFESSSGLKLGDCKFDCINYRLSELKCKLND